MARVPKPRTNTPTRPKEPEKPDLVAFAFLCAVLLVAGLVYFFYTSTIAPDVDNAMFLALAVVFGPVICVVLLWFIGCLLRDGFREVAKVVVYFLWLWTCRKAGKASNEEDWRYPKKFPGGWEN